MVTIYIRTREDVYKMSKFKDKFNMDVRVLVWEKSAWREADEREVKEMLRLQQMT